MALKIHLRANKVVDDQDSYSRCAAQAVGNGKSRRNSRQTYANIPQSHIVDFASFRAAYAANPASVCAHCIDMALPVYNRQRTAKGLAPVKSLFETMGA